MDTLSCYFLCFPKKVISISFLRLPLEGKLSAEQTDEVEDRYKTLPPALRATFSTPLRFAVGVPLCFRGKLDIS
jgi:hypothetical protein